jgi:hypothetical protein
LQEGDLYWPNLKVQLLDADSKVVEEHIIKRLSRLAPDHCPWLNAGQNCYSSVDGKVQTDYEWSAFLRTCIDSSFAPNCVVIAPSNEFNVFIDRPSSELRAVKRVVVSLAENKEDPIPTNLDYQTVRDFVQSQDMTNPPTVQGNWTTDGFKTGICDMDGIEIKEKKIRVGSKWCDIANQEVRAIISETTAGKMEECKDPNKRSSGPSGISCTDPINKYIETIGALISYSCPETTGNSVMSLSIYWPTKAATAISYPHFSGKNEDPRQRLVICE